MPNTALDQYSAGDFSTYGISKLYGGAKKGRSYTHQVDLSTNAYFTKTYNEEMKRYNEKVKNNEGEFNFMIAVYNKEKGSTVIIQ